MQKRLLFLSLFIVALFAASDVQAQFPYANSFKTSSTSGIILGDNAKLTSGAEDPANNGVLRLTNNVQYQKGYCYIDQAFPVTNGLKIEFEYFTYGGNKADGTTFFLFEPSGGFEAGQYGGALGYAQNANSAAGQGMKGGFLAVGLDEYGNFGVATESKNGGFKDVNGNDYTTQNLNGAGNISVRGGVGPSGERYGSTAYPFIGGKITGDDYTNPQPAASQRLALADYFNIATSKRTISENDPEYRKIRLDIQKRAGTNSGFIINLDVFIGGVGRWIKVLDNVVYLIDDSRVPTTLKGGFTASTGFQYNYHEIRNVLITPSASSLVKPTANNDAVTILDGVSSTAINALSNDVVNANPNGAFASGTLDLDPTTSVIDTSYTVTDKGTFTVSSAGVVTFKPVSGYVGVVSIPYNFRDNYSLTSNNATITVTINANKPTVANITKTTIAKNTATVPTKVVFTSADFSSKFTGTNFTSIKVSNLPDQNTVGILRINNGGGLYTTVSEGGTIVLADLSKLEFVPALNYTGSPQFTWNGYNGSYYADVAATVFMSVVNTPPVITNSAEAVTKNVTLTPLVNTTFTGQYTDGNGDALTQIKITQLPLNGKLRGNTGGGVVDLVMGSVITKANLSTIAYVPATGSTANDNFKWQAYDGTDYSNDGLVSITITNSVPTVSAINKTGLEDVVLKFTTADFTASYNDASGNALSVIRFTSLPLAAEGALRINNNGVFTAITANTDIPAANFDKIEFVPAANYFGTVTAFNWNANNGTSYATSTAAVNITISPVNDIPSFTKGADQTVSLNATAQTVPNWATALSTGPANESSQTLLFKVTSNNDLLFSAVPAIASNGTLTFTPMGNSVGKAIVSVVVQDNGGTANGGVDQSAAQTFNIILKPVGSNDVVTTTVGTAVTTPVLNNDAAKTVGGIAVVPVTPSSKGGTTAVDASGNVTYTPPANYVGKDTYTYTLSKDGVSSDIITVSVSVKPIATADQDYTQFNAPVTTSVKTNDSFGGTATNASVVIVSNPTNGTVSVIDATAGTVKYTPNSNSPGTDTYTYKLVTADGVESDPVVVTIKNASLVVKKFSTSSATYTVGSTITYKIDVINNGVVALTNLVLSDQNAVIPAGAASIGTLAAGATTAITVSHVITQAEVDAGEVSNLATVSGNDPKNNSITKSSDDPGTTTPDDATKTTITQTPALSVKKSVTSSGPYTLNSTITYAIEVKNTGNVTLTALSLTDPNAVIPAGASAIGTLAPNTSATITVSHVVTQANIDSGVVSNVATVTGKDPKNNTISKISDDPTTVAVDDPTKTTISQSPAFTVQKSVTSTGPYTLGSTITYKIEVKNTGNVTLNTIKLSDPNAVVAAADANIGTLVPTATKVIVATHLVTQADLDAGLIENIATVTAIDPKGNQLTEVSDDPATLAPKDGTKTTLTQTPAVTVKKTVTSSGPYIAGSVITYTIDVKNTGNVTLSNLTIADANAVIASGQSIISSLAPNGSRTIIVSHTVTQAEVDAGEVSNQATVSGSFNGTPINQLSDDPSTTVDNDPTKTAITPLPAFTITKKLTSTGNYSVGSTIVYTIDVKNTGNVTLSNVMLTDVNAVIPTGAELLGTLAPNDSKTITVAHTVTQADLDAGEVSNQAVVSGSTPKGVKVEKPSDDPTTAAADDPTKAVVAYLPALTVKKSVISAGPYALNSTINYEIEVINSGNVTLSKLTLADANAVIPAGAADVGVLAPGISKKISVSHKVTQGDIDTGWVDNSATVSGVDSRNNAISKTSDDPSTTAANDATRTTITQSPALSVIKAVTSSGTYTAGSTISYAIKVKNTGNVTLSSLTLEDPNAVLPAGSATVGTLAPGAEQTINVTHVVTQVDIDAGKFDNVATVKGKDPKNNTITKTSDDPATAAVDDPTSVTFTFSPAVSASKTVTSSGPYVAGSVITYKIDVKNTGNVTLSSVVLTDVNAAIATGTGTIATLVPGETKSVTASHTLTQSEIDNGEYNNQAAVVAKDPKNNTISTVSDDPSTAAINDPTKLVIPALPSISIKKSITSTGPYPLGSVISYNVLVVNAGNVTLKDVVLADNNGIIPAGKENIGTLAPGGTTNIAVTHTVTQADVDAGKVINQAIVSGNDPQATIVQKESDDPATLSVNDPTQVRVGILDPVAVNDITETENAKEVVISILDNDYADEQLKLDVTTVEIVTQPSHGTVKINADGTIAYTPEKGYIGLDGFTYTVKDELGNVSNVAMVTVTVTGYITPNVFTPNGDGKNDTFTIVGIENYDSADLTIFNRWGNEVYRDRNYKNSWTGEGLNEGTYYYILKLKKGSQDNVRKGWVLIKR